MKTTVIQIDPHDDLVSIKDKMSWVKSARILLILPAKYNPFENELSLKIIQRYALELGSIVGLVSRNRQLNEVAENLGIPYFSSTVKAEKDGWFQKKSSIPYEKRFVKGLQNIISEKENVPKDSGKADPSTLAKIISLLLVMCAFIGMVVFIFPSAIITIYPIVNTQEVTVDFFADQQISTVQITGGIPARLISIERDGLLTKQSTGVVLIPTQKASGSILVTNLTAEELSIPANTVVSTKGDPKIRFQTTREMVLPGGDKNPVEIEIIALQPGLEGNVGTGSIDKVEGELGQLISVQNTSATNGGESLEVPAPSDADFDAIRAQLIEQLQKEAGKELSLIPQKGERLIDESIRIDKIVEEKRMTATNSPSDLASYQMNISFSGLVINTGDEESLAKMILDSSLPSTLIPLNTQILIRQIDRPTQIDNEGVVWRVNASRLVFDRWEEANVLKLITGRKIESAKNIINNSIPQVRSATIEISPEWWIWLPLMPQRIQFRYAGVE
jgi:hypothetical protein